MKRTKHEKMMAQNKEFLVPTQSQRLSHVRQTKERRRRQRAPKTRRYSCTLADSSGDRGGPGGVHADGSENARMLLRMVSITLRVSSEVRGLDMVLVIRVRDIFSTMLVEWMLEDLIVLSISIIIVVDMFERNLNMNER